MYAKLIFKLPEDRTEFEEAQAGGFLVLAVREFDEWLRVKMKYEDQTTLKTEEVRKKLHEILIDYEVERLL